MSSQEIDRTLRSFAATEVSPRSRPGRDALAV